MDGGCNHLFHHFPNKFLPKTAPNTAIAIAWIANRSGSLPSPARNDTAQMMTTKTANIFSKKPQLSTTLGGGADAAGSDTGSGTGSGGGVALGRLRGRVGGVFCSSPIPQPTP